MVFKKKSLTKKILQENINQITGIRATTMPKRVALVNKQFHDNLLLWLNKKLSKAPKNLDTTIFFTSNHIRTDLKRGIDYEIIDTNIWNDLMKKFGPARKIEGILTKDPKTNKETILFFNSNCIQFSIYLPRRVGSTNSYSISMSPIEYYSHPDWLLEDVKKQICQNYQIDPTMFSFSRHESTNPNERINEKIKMGDLSRSYKNDFDLRQNKLNQSSELTSNSKQIPLSMKLHRNPTSSSREMMRSQGARKVSRPQTPIKKNSKISEDQTTIKTPSISSSFSMATNQQPQNNTTTQKITADATVSPSKTTQNNYSNLRAFSSSKNTSLLPKPVGLANLGNTCFFNAAVQCLARVMPLTRFILSDSFNSQLNPLNPKSSRGCIATAYKRFLEGLCRGTPMTPQNPSDLRRAVVSFFSRFANYGQHDSQELLCSLLDGLHEDMNQSSFARGRNPSLPINSESDSWDVHVSRNSSPIVDIFTGILYSSINCPNCGHTEKVRDPFVFLSLEIPRRFASIKLENCLAKFSQRETLNAKNKWKCESCKKMVCATKEMGVEKCGNEALIIHFKRFSGEGLFASKIDTLVDYPDVLEVSTFAKNDRGRFKLIGAVFHSGGLGGGHYTAAAVDPASNEWYNFNDSIARRIDKSEAHNRGAYMLFYQRI